MKILIAGDFCPLNRVAELFEKGDYNTVLGDIKEVIKQIDYSIVNLECPVTKENSTPIKKCGPNLHCSEEGIKALKWAGFNCVTLANNHILDYGDEGLKNTLEVCSKNELDNVGGGYDIQDASKILYKQIGGNKLAVINCCEHEFSIATTSSPGANPLNPIQQYYAIKEAKTNADYVIIIVHGGHEHYQLPSVRMQETYRFFIDSGADAVINSHQHCFSGYEVYNEKPIFYGLGNFCFDGNRSGKEMWHEGYMVQLSFEHNITFKLFPYIQCKSTASVVIIERMSFSNRINKLNDIISNTKKLSKENQIYYSSCSSNYINILEPFWGRVYLAFKYRGWLPSFVSSKRKLKAENLICCESHREKLIYSLKH